MIERLTLITRVSGGGWTTPTMRLYSTLVSASQAAYLHAGAKLAALGVDRDLIAPHLTQWRQRLHPVPDVVVPLTRPDTGEVVLEFMCATVQIQTPPQDWPRPSDAAIATAIDVLEQDLEQGR